jgi:hypothetical protein
MPALLFGFRNVGPRHAVPAKKIITAKERMM